MLLRLQAMELPSVSSAPASREAAAPARLPAMGGRPAEPSWHCRGRLELFPAHSSFPSQGQGAIQNPFGRVSSTVLNTVLVSALHSQQNVGFVPCFVLWLFLKCFQQTFPWRCILTAPPSSCRFLHSKHICLKFKEFPHIPGTLCAMACWVPE